MKELMSKVAAVTLFGFLFAAFPQETEASGGSSTSAPPVASLTPREEAAQLYNEGLRIRDKAWKLEEKLAGSTDEGDRGKLQGKMEKQFGKAVKNFRRAVKLNPEMFQAHSSLGYSLRRLGRYEEALVAYDRALALNPYYTEAIEYRAEAYLGLNRIADAKKAYMLLFAGDRTRADELFEAMEEWLEARRVDSSGLESAELEAFAAWFEGRSELAAQTAQIRSDSGPW